MSKSKLRPPSITWDRIKRALGILIVAFAMEYVDPFPFMKSPGAWFLYAWFIFEVIKQVWAYRLEVSMPAVARAEAYRRRWDYETGKVDPLTRFRIRRLIIIIIGVLIYGQVINLFTERCSNAVSCALLSFNLVFEAAPMIIQIAFGIIFSMVQFAAIFWFMAGVGFGKVVPPGTISVTFDDVFGQDKARDRVMEMVDLLNNDEAVVKAGGHLPKGALLTGPPGTGKTMLAKAAANRSTKPLILLPPGAFASTFVGINFLKVHKLGRWIRKQSARYGGVVVFIDEIDSLGSRGGVEEGHDRMDDEYWWTPQEPGCSALPVPDHGREYPVVVTGGGSGGMNMGTLESFLSMIDGMDEPRGAANKVLAFFGFKPLPPLKARVFYLGATNRPSAVDPALKRAGRMGVNIRVDYPKFPGRLATYDGYLSKVEHELTEDDVAWFARNHYRGTGAEIEDVVNEALLLTFRKGHRPGVVTHDDMMTAMVWKRFGESHGTFENERNKWGVAVHEASHALVMYKLLRERKHIWFVSIEQRERNGGMVAPAPQDDDWKQWHDEMVADVAVSIASRVGEELILGQMTNGHGGDGRAATSHAERLVLMGHTPGQLSFTKDREPEEFHKLREEVLREAYGIAKDIILEDEVALRALAERLLEEPTLPGGEVHKIFEEHNVA